MRPRLSSFRERSLDRRAFLGSSALGLGALGASLSGLPLFAQGDLSSKLARRSEYRGPNVVIVRFGGGVRRRETLDPDKTYCPFVLKELSRRGTLFPKMEIASEKGIETSHGQGTLNILTGKYDGYEDVNKKFLGERFESKVPTLFEYFRKSFDIPSHQTLIVNGEDRIDEEFYTFSNHHNFGVRFRSNVLSLYRFKVWLLRQQIAEGKFDGKRLEGKALAEKKKELDKLEDLDQRVDKSERGGATSPELDAFWGRWKEYYGSSGFVNPRGDRVLTELAMRAIREVRPRLMMINYNDCDYVHWGFMSHYTRAIQIMDEAVERLVKTIEADEAYRGNTILAIVPDCGRDDNKFIAVPCQHHFGSKSSHEIFGLFVGPGIAKGQVVDKKVDQIQVASTIGRLMGFKAKHSEQDVLEEVFA